MASPTGLLALPPEIILYICHMLIPYQTDRPSNYSPKQLAFFSRTCKQVNQIATPVLYSRFIAPPSMPVCLKFLTSVCRHPELGEFVQQLSFRFCSGPMERIDHHAIYFEAAARLGVELGSRPRAHPFQTLTQLIMGHTPNVRTINVFADQFILTPNTSSTVMDQLAKKRMYLWKMERLVVQHFYATSVPIEHYAPIVILSPRLRQLVVEPSSPLEHPWKQPSDLPYLSAVRRLILNLGSLDRDQMRRIVHACGPLELFEHVYSMVCFGSRPSVTPAEMVQILQRHAGTLLGLKLDLVWRNRETPVAFYAGNLCMEGEQIQSLKAFSCLEELELDGSCFLFPDRNDEYYHEYVFTQLLPSSIRIFEITVALPGTVENLRTLAQSASQFPYLERVRMENELLCPTLMHNVFFIWQDVTAVERMMRKAGIYFVNKCSLIGIPPTPSPSIGDATDTESAYFESSDFGPDESDDDGSDADGSGDDESDVDVDDIDMPDAEGLNANGSDADTAP
ncbi:hypothetical protein CCMA1212_001369 [Trichoderma ghanense]|uniref:F-box domain-containing protein n=1 Tax=Trichoderma ghanense TaxID=65468 RepID=A0ABY2HCK9_9HYPO